MTNFNPKPIELDIANEAATAHLAAKLAATARSGDILALDGELGTGKTVFARAFINARTGHIEEVPSPTFTLLQSYRLNNGAIHHFDLYRLNSAEETLELGMEEAFASGISLIEWPQRMGNMLPDERLDVFIAYGTVKQARRITLKGFGHWQQRLKDIGLV